MLEYGIFDGKPTFVSTMQLAPVAPPFTSWLLPEPPGSQGLRGLHTPGAAVPGAATRMGAPYGDLNRPGFPRAGETEGLVCKGMRACVRCCCLLHAVGRVAHGGRAM